MIEPRVIQVVAKDIYVTVELPLEYLKKVNKVISMSEFQYDSSDPEQVKMYDFLNNEFHPFIEGTIQGVEEQTGV